jgi:hypothetical protein
MNAKWLTTVASASTRKRRSVPEDVIAIDAGRAA